jgi:sugar-specific transcriptional regulator TrmB
METKISTLLKEYGLDENEIKVYILLVGNNELTAYNIAKNTKIHRSTCYDVLDRLIKKGFVSKISRKRDYYSANDIGKVISGLKIKENLLLDIIPDLVRIEERQETRVKLMENQESQKEFDIDLLNLIKQDKISYCYVLSNGPSVMESQNILIERLAQEFRKHKNKIAYKGVWDNKLRESKYLKIYKKFGENRFLDLPTKATIVIFDGHVAFLYTTNKPEVIEIKNRMVSEEMKACFLHLWKVARR